MHSIEAMSNQEIHDAPGQPFDEALFQQELLQLGHLDDTVEVWCQGKNGNKVNGGGDDLFPTVTYM